MKAITCSQCGAVIKRIRLRDKIAYCDYCDATIPIIKDKVVEMADKPESEGVKKLTNWEIYQQRRKEVENKFIPHIQPPDDSIDSETKLKLFGLLAAAAALIIIPILLHSFFSSSANVLPGSGRAIESRTAPTPCPNVVVTIYSYYFTGDQHYIEHPELDLSKLPSCDEKELKTTIFSDQNNKVEVELIVDPDGDVIEAKAISGDPLLRRPSEAAAGKSKFIKRANNEKRKITYRFVL